MVPQAVEQGTNVASSERVYRRLRADILNGSLGPGTRLIELHLDERWEAVVQMNISFHEVLYTAAGNERLSAMARSLEETVRRFSGMAFSAPDRLAEVIAEHAAIITALEDGDPERAEAITRRHMVRARANLAQL